MVSSEWNMFCVAYCDIILYLWLGNFKNSADISCRHLGYVFNTCREVSRAILVMELNVWVFQNISKPKLTVNIVLASVFSSKYSQWLANSSPKQDTRTLITSVSVCLWMHWKASITTRRIHKLGHPSAMLICCIHIKIALWVTHTFMFSADMRF